MTSPRAAVLLALVLAGAWVVETMRPTAAMPPFAQAYGMDCQVCHTVVPALNAYGRYVQRTGYASLDPGTIHRADPLWVGENPFYDTQDPNEPHRIQWGNLAIHAAGYIGTDWTFHAQQWVSSADQGGFTDTLWVTYNNLFHRDGHLFIGKLEPPAPSPFSQFFDLAGFGTPSITVGEHVWPFSTNRWGTKLMYTHGWLTAGIGYLGGSADLGGANGATDWGPTTEKTVQWQLTDALGYKPFEFGAYGGAGTFQTSDGQTDRYSGAAGYAQLDPVNGLPGAFAVYQRGRDGHAGAGLGAADHTAYTAEVYEPMLHDQVILAFRNEYTDDGLGHVMHADYANVAWFAIHHVSERLANGLILNVQATMNQGATPSWQGQLWYVTTLGGPRRGD